MHKLEAFMPFQLSGDFLSSSFFGKKRKRMGQLFLLAYWWLSDNIFQQESITS